jgi:hypothetical protein
MAILTPQAVNRRPLAPSMPLLFRSDRTSTPNQHPVTQADLANQNLELMQYGPSGKRILTASQLTRLALILASTCDQALEAANVRCHDSTTSTTEHHGLPQKSRNLMVSSASPDYW